MDFGPQVMHTCSPVGGRVAGWLGGWVGEWVGLRRWPSGQGRWVSGGAFSVVWLDDCRSWAVVLASRVSVRSLDARWRVDHCLASRSLP